MQHSNTKELVRKLEPLEELAWWFDQVTPSHFVMVGEFAGPTLPADWVRALRTVQDRHQLLQVGVVPSPPCFCRTTEPLVPRILSDIEPEHWQASAAAEMQTRFDPFEAPLLRATVLHRPDRATLVLATHHCIGDGISVMHLFGEVLAALAARAGTAIESEAPTPSCSEPLSLLAGAVPPSLHTAKLDVGATDRLRRRCREESTSLFGALAASLVLAGRDRDPGWRNSPVRLVVPKNTRLSNDPGGELRIDLALLRASSAGTAGPGFWDLARHFKRQVAAMAAPDNLMAGANALAGIAAAGFDAPKAEAFMADNIASEGMVTSIGAVPFTTDTGRLSLHALWGPSILTGQQGEQVIGAATVAGRLCLLHTSREPLPVLLDGMVSLLEAPP